MKADRELLQRYLDDALDAGSRAGVEERLRSDASLQTLHSQMQRLRETISEGRADSFAPFFADRVMRRLAPARLAARGESMYEALRFAFARTAAAGLLIAGALAVFNLVAYGDLEVVSSIPEALFGLPSASVIDALSYNAF